MVYSFRKCGAPNNFKGGEDFISNWTMSTRSVTKGVYVFLAGNIAWSIGFKIDDYYFRPKLLSRAGEKEQQSTILLDLTAQNCKQ